MNKIILTFAIILTLFSCKKDKDSVNILPLVEIEKYTLDSLLNTSLVLDIAADNNGNVWISTSKGLCQYNNGEYKIYTESDGLLVEFVGTVFIDNLKNIWVGYGVEGGGYSGGVSKFDGNKWTHYNNSDGLDNLFINVIIQDNQNKIWVGSSIEGESNFDGTKWTNFNKCHVLSMCLDHSGNVWLGGNSPSIFKYDGNNWLLYYLPNDTIYSHQIHHIYEDINYHLWFGTSNGILEYYNETWIDRTAEFNLINTEVYDIVQDSTNTFWIASNSGIRSYNGSICKTYRTEDGLLGNEVSSICIDKKGNIWFGILSSKKGINIYNGQSFTILKE